MKVNASDCIRIIMELDVYICSFFCTMEISSSDGSSVNEWFVAPWVGVN